MHLKLLRRLFILSLGLTICLTPPRALAQENSASPDASPPAARVIVLPPQVVFERASSRSHIQDDPEAAPYESVLTTAATSGLSLRKYAPVAAESLRNSDAGEWLGKLSPLTSRLARGAINDEARETLGHLAALPEDYLVLVQFFRAEAGPAGSYNPFSGGITSAMSSTLVQAALISARTGQVAWKNEVLERKLFRADDPRFGKIIETLYQTLEKRRGNL